MTFICNFAVYQFADSIHFIIKPSTFIYLFNKLILFHLSIYKCLVHGINYQPSLLNIKIHPSKSKFLNHFFYLYWIFHRIYCQLDLFQFLFLLIDHFKICRSKRNRSQIKELLFHWEYFQKINLDISLLILIRISLCRAHNFISILLRIYCQITIFRFLYHLFYHQSILLNKKSNLWK